MLRKSSSVLGVNALRTSPLLVRGFSEAPIEKIDPAKLRLSNPGLVVFDKDGTLIDFTIMWSSWAENLAWRLEQKSRCELREVLFDKLGYDYLKRRVHSGGMVFLFFL